MYQVTMTKESVAKISDVLYVITVGVVVNDGTSNVFESTVSKKYNSTTPNLANFKSEILAELQAKWDRYVAEQAIKNAAAFDAALTEMQNQATAYVNS